MTIEFVLGQPALFRILGDPPYFPELSKREARITVGALNFHALMAPERVLEVHFYDGNWETTPRTSDDSTFTGRSRHNRNRTRTLRIESLMRAEDPARWAGTEHARELIAPPRRHIHISRDAVLKYDPPRNIARDPIRKVMSAVRAKTPLLYDDARDLELLRHRYPLTHAVERRAYEAEFAPGGNHQENEIVPAPAAFDGAPKAVIVGMHWLETGGAERWAFETVRLIREAGFLPIVISNRDSHHPLITRPEFDGAIVIPFSEPTALSQTPGVEELLRAVFTNFDVHGVVVHHNQWLYDRLHWIRASRPNLPVVDSTHIVEYRGGGYPVSSALVADAITTHHVISPALERWMTNVQNIDPATLVMAPLIGLTANPEDGTFREKAPGETFTVAFIGRMSRQKAPEVFIEIVARARKANLGLRYIMHGDGELSGLMDDLIRAEGLESIIERRDSSVPVAQTLAESHLLVVSSHNEGLTLTTFEALAAGVPVISTDVGAQSDIVPPDALAPRYARSAVRSLFEKLAVLSVDEQARRELWEVERQSEAVLLSHQSANAWFAQEVSQW
ncbi:glycosyltransferase family 4 protein [Microbacterium mitrae]|uniref:Glycosyltransferase family 4 protein n=1 Tax=Microbacterium mitrae TaxID=664640 RepID=A0A5C8HPP3_9MICO|nr:glycosyltransferase [Microbacterium mitrae]TXK06110.1 glycosyltransferase family 4 protein [Microbacterium mitrae]